MPKQIVARVHTDYEDGEYGPDYALIQVGTSGSVSNLELKMKDTVAMFLKHGGKPESLGIGPLQGTLWWLSDTLLEVTWLCYDALLDDEGEEPDWMDGLLDESWAIVEGFEPNLGDEDECGRPENQFTAVDLQYILLMPDGNFELQAHVDFGGYSFRTAEIPLCKLLEG